MLDRRFHELKARRLKRKWSQQDLSEESGVSAATISMLERGLVEAKLTTMERLAHALRCSVSTIAKRREDIDGG